MFAFFFCLFVFWSLLNFRRIILNSLTVCRSLFTSVIFGVVSSGGDIFSFSGPLIPYVCVCTVEYLDFSYTVLSGCFGRDRFSQSTQFRFLGMSVDSVLGQVEPGYYKMLCF